MNRNRRIQKPILENPALQATLPRPEDLAHQTLDHEGVQAEALLLHFLVKLVDEEVVVELHGSAGGVGEELADEMAAEQIGTGVADDFLEAGEVGVGLAGVEFAGGVDLGGVLGVFRLRIGFAPAADGIEGFKAEAQRASLAMTLGIGAMFREATKRNDCCKDARLPENSGAVV